MEACRSAGARLGLVLGAIHSDDALHEGSRLNQFVNPDATDMWANEVVGKIKELLVKHLPRGEGDASELQRVEDEAEVVSGIIQRDYERQDEAGGPRRTMFSNGDLWTGSILMNPTENTDIGLIDWEFAGEGRMLQDLGQLSASLHLFAQASGWSTSDASSLVISPANHHVTSSPPWIFAKACFMAYALRLRASRFHSWIINADRPEEERFRLQVIRSTWILHGRELVFNATLTDTAYKFERILHSNVEAWRKKVVELACWYVRVAAETTDADFKVAVGKEMFLSPLYNFHN